METVKCPKCKHEFSIGQKPPTDWEMRREKTIEIARALAVYPKKKVKVIGDDKLRNNAHPARDWHDADTAAKNGAKN